MRAVGSVRATRAIAAALFGSVIALGASPASAQVHWDADAQIGLGKRFLTSAYAQPSLGPAALVAAHVAIVPLLRVGPYVAFDVSPVGSESSRRFFSAGLRAKVQAPWATERFHGWAFAGAGYAGVYQPSETRSLTVEPTGPLATGQPTQSPFDVGGAGGGFVEVPFGVGLGARLRRPWEIVFELGGRVGFAFGGSVYRGRDAVSPTVGTQNLAPVGKDTIGVFLTGGIGFDL